MKTPIVHQDNPLPAGAAHVGELLIPSRREPHEALLDAVDLGSPSENVTLRSGRRYELTTTDAADHLTVKSASGRVLLRVALTDAGPLLSFESAEITLSARNRLALTAPEIALHTGALNVHAGSSEERIEGHRHTHVRGEDRLEAGAVAIQANDRGVSLRAMERIALDGEHIGLNDDPCPKPFAWSAVASDTPLEENHDDA